ncbi:DUF421 domain-containing protein [Roseobacter sp. CCS2]|uniref:DUF421 domain-containing protein n=1 Tax=Roseobacter sp. CCS2 TaxID=391593 RepID=UPI0000F3C6ED|nr:YetF domain-containing protein [Roseobacter sp. CCS2]EBA11644.1 hypothetical protein RCCS2_16986 [Roseobacter sp. CCS2]
MFTAIEQIDVILRAIALSTVAVCWVVVVVRYVGLRAFSKMTAFDFVVTVAIGSLLAGASQATSWAGFVQAAIAIASLLLVQMIVARLRVSSDSFSNTIQNAPVLLMEDGEIIDAALDHTRVTRDDLIAKLREANVLALSDVRAVVLETTGDISVLHGSELDDVLVADVKRIAR